MHERKPIWPGVLSPEVENYWRQVHDFLCQHLICLGVRYVPIDAQGNPSGKEKLRRYSCFVVSLRGKWFLVTAGHCLKELADPLADGRIRIVRAFLVDYLGHRETIRRLTPFHFDISNQRYVDEPEQGLDYGFIPLRDLYKLGLEANGIKAISEKHWSCVKIPPFSTYALLGLPAEVSPGYDPNLEVEDPLNGLIGSVVVSAKQLEDKSLIPDEVSDALKTGPWFLGRITADTKLDIKGMSGGPIFGLVNIDDGKVGYTVVAIQSRWHKSSKIIFGCPITLFGEMVERYEAALLSKQ